MRIQELEQHHDECIALDRSIQAMVGVRDFPAVFAECESSFPHIAPAIQFRKKRGITPVSPPLLPVRVICRYAPPLFEHGVLESLQAFVKSTRVLARDEDDYLEATTRVLEREEVARVLWNGLEQRPGLLERDIDKEFGLPRESVAEILEVWGEVGLVDRSAHDQARSVSFRCPQDAVAEGMCPTCGIRGKESKELFFAPIRCKACDIKQYYHIIYADL